MNNTLIKFLHIKCTSIEIVRQIAQVLVTYDQRDESAEAAHVQPHLPPRSQERCRKARKINMRDGSE